MRQSAWAPTLRRLGGLAAILTAVIPPSRAAAEMPPIPEPPSAAPFQPVPPAAPLPMEARRPIEAQVGVRLGARAQNPIKPDKLNDLGMDGRVEVQLSGAMNGFLKWQAAFIGTLGLTDQSNQAAPTSRQTEDGFEVDGKAAVLDLIGRLELHEAFNLWVGRLLVPADRAGLSTVWSIAPWLFPGQFTFTGFPAGARQGRYGRSDGATLWGDLWGGAFKYYLGVYNLADPRLAPLYSGRLCLNLLNPEPGYRIASSYYGNKDILAIGVGLQHQADGSTLIIYPKTAAPEDIDAWDDFTELNVDLLFEKNLGGAGVLDVEGAFYKIWGHYEPETWAAFALVSYLLPIEVGWGRFQPLFRLQRASPRNRDGSDTLADAQLGYIIDGSRARVVLGYQYSKVSAQTGNALLFGLQLVTR